MASKRKKSRPTKLADNYELVEHNDFLRDEDSTTRIQRFLDHESEDTPESRSVAIKQMPSTNILGPCERLLTGVKSSAERRTTNPDHVNGISAMDCIQNEVTSQTAITGWQIIDDATAHFSTFLSKEANINIPEDENLSPGIEKKKPQQKRYSRNRDPQDSPRYSCTTCKYVTNRSDHFKRHLMTHSEDKPLKCTMCNYGTGRSDHYKRHLQRHGMSDAAIIECCEKNGLKLKNSSLTPTDDDKKAKENGQTSKGVLKQIRPGRPYTSVWKKFVCDSCGYTTDKSSHFHRHIRTHVNDKPHVCEACKKSFKLPLYLNKHRCSKTAQRRCGVCKSIFIDRGVLVEHMATAHPDVSMPPEETEPTEEKEPDSPKASDEAEPNRTEPPSTEQRSSSAVGELHDSNSFFSNFSKMASEIICNNLTPENYTAAPNNSDTDDAAESGEVRSQSNSGVTKSPPTASEGGKSCGPDDENEIDTIMPTPFDMKAKGNLKCTKCGAWFEKLDEYTSHPCIT